MDLATLGSALLVYGPLGVLSALGIFWRLQADKERQSLGTSFAEKVAAMQTSHREEVAKLVGEHRDEVSGLISIHQEQTEKLTDRLISVVDRNQQTLDKVVAVAEAMQRSSQRR